MLADHPWQLKYTPDDGDLIGMFYVPALAEAERYDRLTGYFDAGALALAARGVEGLVRNRGRMRLIVGCTLGADEIEAIARGETLREQVERRLARLPLAPPDAEAEGALALLAWMVAGGHLEVKAAVPCDAARRPVADGAIFHEKSGVIEDRGGDRIAWTGSLNETAAGWQRNWETINVATSWGPEPGRVAEEERNFARLWADRALRAVVLDVPEAARRDLLRFLPADGGLPARLEAADGDGTEAGAADGRPASPPEPPPPAPPPEHDRRALVWTFIREAPRRAAGGERVGEATAAVTPWPHQVRAFERLYRQWPPKLLIADEVGLGKTIQAGLLLRQAWLAGRARRILILAPRAVLPQWQLELREKFNLNWPIYDGRRLLRDPSPALRGSAERAVDADRWHAEPAVIASSQLLRRRDRAPALLEAEPWDLVVVDEAHHARRRAAGSARDRGPNELLRLLRALRERTAGLVLLTATPMQVDPVEVWDLLSLLGLPPEWTEEAFLQFFDDLAEPSPSAAAMERMAQLFQAAERAWGQAASAAEVRRLTGLTPLKANQVLRALRDSATIPRRQLDAPERRAALAVLRAHTPLRHLVSRHTRALLRRYFRAGLLATPIAERRVEDRFIDLSAAEREVYEAVESYIGAAYARAGAAERSAVGFVMTIYRRRLASSFRALRATLERHRAAVYGGGAGGLRAGGEPTPRGVPSPRGGPQLAGPEALEEDLPDDEAGDELLDADEAGDRERRVLAAAQRAEINLLLAAIARLPPDGKLAHLRRVCADLRAAGYRQAMVFTQYTATMDFLREALSGDAGLRLLCFSGRGGEAPAADGSWRAIGRDEARRRFRDGEADLLLCTDAAAEGLNFQFCGALINYDMPWNPMRVEQRIGRIDRLGQAHSLIRIVNLHYEDTVETDVYRALRDRIGLFENVVGRLQPILAQMPQAISTAVLGAGAGGGAAGSGAREARRAAAVAALEREAAAAEAGGFDLDAALEQDAAPGAAPDAPLTLPPREAPALTLDDLERVIADPALLPPGSEAQPLAPREYGLLAPGMAARLRVTTDPAYYAEHAESVELWSPGNPLFRSPEHLPPAAALPSAAALSDLLQRPGP